MTMIEEYPRMDSQNKSSSLLNGLFPDIPDHKMRACAVSLRRSLLQHVRWLEQVEMPGDPEVIAYYRGQLAIFKMVADVLAEQYGIAGRWNKYDNKQDVDFTKGEK